MKSSIDLVVMFALRIWHGRRIPQMSKSGALKFKRLNMSIARLHQLCGAALRWVPGVAFFLDFPRSKKCVIGSPIINACYGYGGYSDWRLLGPGLGMLGAGGVLVVTSIRRQHQSAKRLEDLRSIGTLRGGTFVLHPTSLGFAYRW
jgi:hypothetical protein